MNVTWMEVKKKVGEAVKSSWIGTFEGKKIFLISQVNDRKMYKPSTKFILEATNEEIASMEQWNGKDVLEFSRFDDAQDEAETILEVFYREGNKE